MTEDQPSAKAWEAAEDCLTEDGAGGLHFVIHVSKLKRVALAFDAFALVALRAALPWDLPPERLEAMARRACPAPNAPTLWMEYSEKTLAAYRADPLFKELYPEKFTTAP